MGVEFLDSFVNQVSNDDLRRLRSMTEVETKRRASLFENVDKQPVQSLDEAMRGGAHGLNEMRERGETPARTGRITLENIERVMAYQQWGPGQRASGAVVREALVAAAKAILREVPDGREKARALECIIDARMHANAAISFDGEF